MKAANVRPLVAPGNRASIARVPTATTWSFVIRMLGSARNVTTEHTASEQKSSQTKTRDERQRT